MDLTSDLSDAVKAATKLPQSFYAVINLGLLFSDRGKMKEAEDKFWPRSLRSNSDTGRVGTPPDSLDSSLDVYIP